MPIQLDYAWEHRRLHKSRYNPDHRPVISNVAISSSGLVTWTTDVACSSQVLYGGTVYLGASTAYDGTATTSHSVQLSGLIPNLTYYLRVQSFYIDAVSISGLYSFQITESYHALILRSPDSTRWAVTVTTDGNLDTEETATGPAGCYEPSSIIFRDSENNCWEVAIQDSGNLETTAVAENPNALSSISLEDSGAVIWAVSVSIDGNLVTT